VSNRLSADTSAEVERLQIERWRAMSAVEKLAIVTGLTRAAFELAAAGVRRRYPEATEGEQFLRLAIVTLGPELARKAYPDCAVLDGR
jgi:hypothetical protein